MRLRDHVNMLFYSVILNFLSSDSYLQSTKIGEFTYSTALLSTHGLATGNVNYMLYFIKILYLIKYVLTLLMQKKVCVNILNILIVVLIKVLNNLISNLISSRVLYVVCSRNAFVSFYITNGCFGSFLVHTKWLYIKPTSVI